MSNIPRIILRHCLFTVKQDLLLTPLLFTLVQAKGVKILQFPLKTGKKTFQKLPAVLFYNILNFLNKPDIPIRPDQCAANLPVPGQNIINIGTRAADGIGSA